MRNHEMLMPGSSYKTIAANGMEFAYLEAGQGPLVLCLHGFPETPYGFQPLLERLAADGFHAVAPFMRGYAPSGLAPDGDYSLPALARDVIALIEHFGVEKAYLVGHGWGGLAALMASILRPDRLRRVVSVSAPHPRRMLMRASLAQWRRLAHLLPMQVPVWARKHLVRRKFQWVERLASRWSPNAQLPPEMFDEFRAAVADKAHLNAVIGYHRAILRSLLDPAFWQMTLHPVTVPTRILHGLDDGCTGAELFAGQESLFAAGLEVVALPGIGHFPHREDPQGFVDLVSEFLLRPTGPA